jgi:drug/metabolite transporter (DMT)-like permease
VLAAQHKAEPVEKPQEKEPQQRGLLPPGVLWAILAAFGLGVTFWLLGFTVTPALGDALPIWLFRLVTACLMVPLALGSRFGESESGLVPPRGDVLGLVAGIGLLDTGAFIASTLGFATGQVAIVSVLSSLYSAVAVMLAWIFLKEPLRAIQWAGILLLLIGIVLTHL